MIRITASTRDKDVQLRLEKAFKECFAKLTNEELHELQTKISAYLKQSSIIKQNK